MERWDRREKGLVEKDRLERWRLASRAWEVWQPGTDPGGRRVVTEATAPTKQVLRLHKGLRKAESALLVQARTGKIGLAKFLNSMHVPGYETAKCECGAGQETPRHMVIFCPREAGRRSQLADTAGRKWTYPQLVGMNEAAKCFVKWIMQSNRLSQFSLAKRLLYHSE